MRGKKTLRWTLAALCVLSAVLLAAAALQIEREGGYTPGSVAAHAGAPLLALAATAGTALVSALLGVRDESGPARDAVWLPARTGRDPKRLRAALLVLAAALIAIGVWNGSMYDVLAKAAKICTECVGLG